MMRMLKWVGKKEKILDNGLPTFYTVGWANLMSLGVIDPFILTTSLLAMCGYFLTQILFLALKLNGKML